MSMKTICTIYIVMPPYHIHIQINMKNHLEYYQLAIDRFPYIFNGIH